MFIHVYNNHNKNTVGVFCTVVIVTQNNVECRHINMGPQMVCTYLCREGLRAEKSTTAEKSTGGF